MLALKVGNNYYTIGQGNVLQKISESDILARSNNTPISQQIQNGDIKVVDPSSITLQQEVNSLGGGRTELGQGYNLLVNGQPLALGGSTVKINNQAEAQALGINPGNATLTPGGSVATDTEYTQAMSDYAKGSSTNTVKAPTTGIYADILTNYAGNSQLQGQDFYKVKVPITPSNPGGYDIYDKNGKKVDFNQFQSLGLNASWIPDKTGTVQPGQPVGAPGSSQNQPGMTGGTGVDQQALDALKFVFGWSDAQAQQFLATDPNAKSMALMAEYLKGQEDKGNLQAQVNAQTLNDAYQAALKELQDPNSPLGSKYADLQKTDVSNFQNNLQALQGGTQLQTDQQKLQFQKQQQDLAEAAAAAGQAYSGFRQRAAQDLGTQQSGIVKSSLSELEQNLRSQFQPLETYYGSQQFGQLFPNAGVSYTNPLTGQTQNVAYTPVGGLTGTQKAQKESDLLNRQQQIFGLTQPQ